MDLSGADYIKEVRFFSVSVSERVCPAWSILVKKTGGKL